MATIDKLDLSVYNIYAIRTKMVEQINQQLQLDKASAIPPQVHVVDIFPKLTELDLVMGIVPLNVPWAYFYPPPRLHNLRRSPFTFSRVIPSMGSEEDQEEDIALLDSVDTSTSEEASEKDALLRCFAQVKTINKWMGYIVGRIGQFLQG